MRVCPKCGTKYLRDEPFCNKDGVQTQAATDVLSDPGAIVGATLGSYLVQELLGVGGMGRVYKAEHTLLGRQVALKILHEELSVRPELVQRFFNEARSVNQIRHENIIDITDFGTTPDGLSYFVMELLEGSSLEAELRDVKALTERRALHIAVQISSALSAAHAKGIIHRDLKPANVLLVKRSHTPDFVKLLDFGIAKLMDTAAGSATKTGVVIGTPTYMSPEQATGQAIDVRSDIYSFGIILYRMLAGRVPLEGDSLPVLMRKHLTEIPSPLSSLNPSVSPRLEAAVMRCLEKEREDRFQTMAALHAELRALGGTPSQTSVPRIMPPASASAAVTEDAVTITQPPPEGQPTTMRGAAGEVWRPSKSRWPLIAVAVVVGASAATALGILIVRGEGDERAARPAAEAVEETETRLLSDPPGALVLDDGEELGSTPMRIDTDRDREITLRLPDYREKTIILARGTDRKMVVELVRLRDDLDGDGEPDFLDVEDAAGATIEIEGVSVSGKLDDADGDGAPVAGKSATAAPRPGPAAVAKRPTKPRPTKPRPTKPRPTKPRPSAAKTAAPKAAATTATKKSPFGLRD